jgi:hypothetical protein
MKTALAKKIDPMYIPPKIAEYCTVGLAIRPYNIAKKPYNEYSKVPTK